MESEANPFQTPVDAVVVETPRRCPECGGDMDPGFVRTFVLRWDDGRRPWWKVLLFHYESLLRLPFLRISPPKLPSQRCRDCRIVVIELQKYGR